MDQKKDWGDMLVAEKILLEEAAIGQFLPTFIMQYEKTIR